MTSDIIQNSFLSPEHDSLARNALSGKRFGASRSERFGFFGKAKDSAKQNSAADINSDVAVKTSTEKSSIDKTALLKTAYKMLRQAEDALAQKEKRIQALQEIVTVDELTGLSNRRGFYRSFESELDRTNRGENEGGLLIMVDLDYFKSINDRHGHMAGDEALRIVGQFLRNTTRPMDVAARLGGDEFIILMPNTNIGKALARARKIGNALNDLCFEWKDAVIRINASIGLKEFTRGDTLESIIDQADKGLYEDKEARKSAFISAAE